ncbi:cell wall hydrolase [Sphingosinicella rhizophila]|uniref:Cell wall hydrolase n=1 Tax=Sphingosinicella rhizophila TaxID=3050082 RepID=A0ABU3Q3W8_9SPHN|nr:cell wall hydrolase [Sphingosinicella sp. GR2756]MDT9597643.1 cell wall hydrolase [Sphingosinicella sp. GR2756]
MFVRSLLCLGLLLTGASCVPPAIGHDSGVPRAATGRGSALTAPAQAPIKLPPSEVIAAAIAPGHAAQPFDPGAQSGENIRRSLQCLTEAVYHEARSETEGGQRAVAQVVLNRVRHPAFPNNICGVVYQGSWRRTGCQFSFTCDGSLRRRIESGAWSRARGVAEEALGGEVYTPVGLATHYHTTAIRPWWASSLTRAVTVGSHIFYRWRGEWGDPKSFRQPYSGEEQGSDSTLAAASNRPESKLVETVFGVRIHHGGRAPEIISDAPVRIHRSETVHGVRIRAGVPPQFDQEVPVAEVAAISSGPAPTS